MTNGWWTWWGCLETGSSRLSWLDIGTPSLVSSGFWSSFGFVSFSIAELKPDAWWEHMMQKGFQFLWNTTQRVKIKTLSSMYVFIISYKASLKSLHLFRLSLQRSVTEQAVITWVLTCSVFNLRKQQYLILIFGTDFRINTKNVFGPVVRKDVTGWVWSEEQKQKV